MPKKALTDRWLKTVKTDELKEEFIDTSFNEKGSFDVIISKTGTKRFFHRYSINGKKRRDNLGSYPSLSLSAARERAIENVSQLNKGSDPSLVKQQYRAAETFGELAELFLKRSEERLAPETLKNYYKMYQLDLEPAWGNRKAVDITKADVIQVLEHICFDRKAPTKSNRTYELISRIFNFGISRDILQYNPVQGLEKLGEVRRGERVFTHDEIKLFWLACEKQRPHIRSIFRLLLLTGQRPGEIKSLEWAHIDQTNLTIPSTNSKNRRKHQIHLTPLALRELEFMREHYSGNRYVFAVADAAEPIAYLNKGHQAIVRTMEEISKTAATPVIDASVFRDGVRHWTPRDIRRTVQTRMAELGVRPDVVDRVLNHNVAGVRRHYDHYSYFPEIRKALIRWERRLGDVFSNADDKKVVNLR